MTNPYPNTTPDDIWAAEQRAVTVERLARALWNADQPWEANGNPYGELLPVEWNEADEKQRDVWRHMARKVIAELDQEET